MRIINIVDNLNKVNFGIWNAAIATAPLLKSKYGVTSELWYPPTSETIDKNLFPDVEMKEVYPEKLHLPENGSIVVTHGVWRFPTRWGYQLSNRGYSWMYVPHGMLEPWSMQQKWLKKKIYFILKEKPMALSADWVRAVGTPEYKNLRSIFNNASLIPNGTHVPPLFPLREKTNNYTFLFMARLHAKKGIVPLIDAWIRTLNNLDNCTLIIAGPDQGEWHKAEALIRKNNTRNIQYRGSVYGEEKKKLLHSSHFYVLPSHSEGFPTSVVEAMSYGMIPLISQGCNFPEAFENKLAYETTPHVSNIRKVLEKAINLPWNDFSAMSARTYEFIRDHYNLEHIADLQYEIFRKMLEM